MFKATCTIGQAVLRNAILVQRNTVSTEIDIYKTGCITCRDVMDDPIGACEKCTRKIMKKVRRNERARYGDRKPLSRTGILIYLLLHFITPDSCGRLRFDVEDVKDIVGCTKRTVENNLRKMKEAGYIDYFTADIPGYYYVFLLGSSEYYKPASEGGRGYIYLNYDIFRIFTQASSLNELRMVIRAVLLSMENNQLGTITELSYREIRTFLPKYLTCADIRRLIHGEVVQSVFHTTEKKFTCSMRVHAPYNMATVRDRIISDASEKVREKIKSLSKQAKEYKIKPITLIDEEIRSTAAVALTCPVPYLLKGIQDVFDIYCKSGLRIRSFSALVRAFAVQREELDILGLELAA